MIGVNGAFRLIPRVRGDSVCQRRLSSPSVIARTGSAAPHRVALMFDNRPDSRWSPDVHDTPAARGVPATFCIIGEHALREIPVTQRWLVGWDTRDGRGATGRVAEPSVASPRGTRPQQPL